MEMENILLSISVFLVTSLMVFIMASSLGTPDAEKRIDYRPGGLWD